MIKYSHPSIDIRVGPSLSRSILHSAWIKCSGAVVFLHLLFLHTRTSKHTTPPESPLDGYIAQYTLKGNCHSMGYKTVVAYLFSFGQRSRPYFTSNSSQRRLNQSRSSRQTAHVKGMFETLILVLGIRYWYMSIDLKQVLPKPCQIAAIVASYGLQVVVFISCTRYLDRQLA